MRKFMVIAIPILSLLLFIAIMISARYLKMPIGSENSVPDSIEEIIDIIKNEQWEEAETKAKELRDNWERIVKRIQFGAEHEEISQLNINLARLEGAIIAQDQSNAIIELKEAFENWNRIGE